MAKVKINKFEGLVTNLDENDLRPDVFRGSVNFRHERGYAEVEPKALVEYDTPDIDTFHGDAPGTWSWETGIYTILTNDIHAPDPTPAQYQVLVLVGKKETAGTYYRSIWFKDVGNAGTWMEMSEEGHPAYTELSRTAFETTIDGDVKLVQDRGILKIYMPHDSFWLGRLTRKFAYRTSRPLLESGTDIVFIGGSVNRAEINYDTWYIDRLTEKLKTQPTMSTDTLDIAVSQATIIDDELRLRLATSFNTIAFDVAPAEVKNKYKKALRTLAAQNALGYHYFLFKKLTDASTIIPDEYVWGNAAYSGPLYREVATGAATTHPQGTMKSYENDFSEIPGIDYSAEGVVTNEIIYASEVIEREVFVGPTDIAVTAILDRSTEIVVESGNIVSIPVDPDLPTASEKYYINYDLAIPENINKRITDIKIYVRPYFYDTDKQEWVPEADYKEAKHYDLMWYADTATEYTEMFGTLSPNDFTGVILSQNIGIIYDPDDYEIVTGFRDYAIEQGVGIGITYDDYINVYHSVVGGGILQSDLVYPQNQVALPGIAFVNAVTGLNGNIGVFTDSTMYIIKPSEIAGVLAFAVINTLEYGVKGFKDVAEVQGGVIIHTENGIYLTNGYDKTWMSEAINNIVEDNYATGTILYNRFKHELYYRPTVADDIYRYRIERKVWETLNVTDTEIFEITDANDILLDLSGERAYLTDSTLYVYDPNGEHNGSSLTSNRTDLGEASIDKLLNEVWVDYIGNATLSIYRDGTTMTTMSLTDRTSRGYVRFFVPLNARKAFNKIHFLLSTTDTDFKIYGVEFDFSPLRYRQNG